MGQGQFDGFSDFLFLHVQPTDIGICDVRLLIGTKHGDGRIGFRREDVDQGVGVAMKGDRGGGFELFTVKGRKYSYNVVGAR